MYLSISSIYGGFTVIPAKAIDFSNKNTVIGCNQFDRWIPWVALLCFIVAVIIQIIYSNESLEHFNTSLVFAVYYVLYTASTILGSQMLFKDWNDMHVSGILAVLLGCGIVFVGIVLLVIYKNDNRKKSDQVVSPVEEYNDSKK